MKAETILKLIERAREPMLKEAHIKAYAEAVIEKDRERIKRIFSEDWEKFLIDELPIILD